MMNFKRGSHLTTLIAVLAGLVLAPIAFADDADDVLALVKQYGDSEGDLSSQAKLMRSDRVYITGGMRQTDEAKNMAMQMAVRAANEAVNGGKTKWFSVLEVPVIRVYGNVAVASFVRAFQTIPHNQPANPPGQPVWVTLVLVKEGGKWGIAHTHQSPAGGN
ncbi:MAG: hypothetical protein ACI88G_000421 [Woeseiaceae bacterium]|jgi:hypothetical protein